MNTKIKLYISEKYLNFHSLTQKRDNVIVMTNWAFFKSHLRYQKNLELIINILLNNDLLSFIFDTINSQLKLKYSLRKRDFISKKKKKDNKCILQHAMIHSTLPTKICWQI